MTDNVIKSGGQAIHCWRMSSNGLVADNLRIHDNTGLPVVVNTSLNTAGRPMVDDPRDALECFGSAPVDLLAIGPFVVRRAKPTSRTGA